MKNLILILAVLTFIGCEKENIQTTNDNNTPLDSIAYYINNGDYLPYSTHAEHELKGIVVYQDNSFYVDSSQVDSVYLRVKFGVTIDFQAEYFRYLNLISQGGTINNLDTTTHVLFNSYQCFVLNMTNCTHLEVFNVLIDPIIKVKWSDTVSGMLVGTSNTTVSFAIEKNQFLTADQNNSGWWIDESTIRQTMRNAIQNRKFVMGAINSDKGRYYPGADWYNNF